MTLDRDLRHQYLWVVRTMVLTAGVALALGLFLHLSSLNPQAADQALRTGLILLMSTPVVRTLIAVSERIRRRDVHYLVATGLVLFELSLTLWYAATRV